eukprot:scaffold10534_cov41-Cylindrotheca_fusiformis.AAC.1
MRLLEVSVELSSGRLNSILPANSNPPSDLDAYILEQHQKHPPLLIITRAHDVSAFILGMATQ